MGKHRKSSRLSIKLLAAAMISLILAGVIYVLLSFVCEQSIVKRYQGDLPRKQLVDAATRFQAFVDDASLSVSDREKIDEWVRRERYLDMYIAKEMQMVYISGFTLSYITDSEDQFSDLYELLDCYLPKDNCFDIEFADGPGKIYLQGFYEMRDFMYSFFVSIALAVVGFAVSLLLLIRRKTQYIVRLRDELQILEGGDLHYAITVQGNDELGDLASGIEAMRNAFLQRLEGEKYQHIVGLELAADMSHDLCSPLTSLIGYLEILAQGKYKNEAQMRRYMEAGKDKAYQLKDLSDRLFDHFLDAGRENGTEREKLLCLPLMEQLVGEGVFDLENKGFTVEYSPLTSPCSMWGDVYLLRRGIENLFSNISRYADREKSVVIVCGLTGDNLHISFENTVNTRVNAEKGTGIGLHICKIMALEHGGEFTFGESDGVWSARLLFPTINN